MVPTVLWAKLCGVVADYSGCLATSLRRQHTASDLELDFEDPYFLEDVEFAAGLARESISCDEACGWYTLDDIYLTLCKRLAIQQTGGPLVSCHVPDDNVPLFPEGT